MHTFTDSKFKKRVVSIGPGEYYVTEEDLIIQTVLGSCIAVCLFTDNGITCGMNHFMLPGGSGTETMDSLRYGIYSMEMLINSLLKLGIQKKDLKAKVFGGGNIIDFKSIKNTVGENNIDFIFDFLKKEDLPVITKHVGGDNARKVLFFSVDKKVLVKEINKTEKDDTVTAEKEYSKTIVKKQQQQESNIIWFDN
jgi:chemotaxis protein CheD